MGKLKRAIKYNREWREAKVRAGGHPDVFELTTHSGEIRYLGQQANQIYDAAVSRLMRQKKQSVESLTRLGSLRLSVWADSIAPFISVLSTFSDVPLFLTDGTSNTHNDVSYSDVLKLYARYCENAQTLARDKYLHSIDGAFLGSALYGIRPLLSADTILDVIDAFEDAVESSAVIDWLTNSAVTTAFGYGQPIQPNFDVSAVSVWTGMFSRSAANDQVIQAKQALSKARNVAAEIDAISGETKYIQTVANTFCDYISSYCERIQPLISELRTINQDYPTQQKSGKTPYGVLSEMEQRAISTTFELVWSLCSLLTLPILGNSANVMVDATEAESIAETRFMACCASFDALVHEKEEASRILNDTCSYYERLCSDHHNQKALLKEELRRFGEDKLTVWNSIGKSYFNALSRLSDVPFSEEVRSLPPIYSRESAIVAATNITRTAESFVNNGQLPSEEQLIHLAYNSFELNSAGGDVLFRWLSEDASEDVCVDGVNHRSFIIVSDIIDTITGKETVSDATEIANKVHLAAQGIQSVNAKMAMLTDTLRNYSKEQKRLTKSFLPLANSVVAIAAPYTTDTTLSLTSQEQKTVSVSWDYAQLLLKVFTDSFYRNDISSLVLNDGVPDVIAKSLKTIQANSFKFRGEAAYAVDAVWKPRAERLKWIGFGLTGFLTILGITVAVLVSHLGLLYLIAAAISFPLFFIKKDMAFNELVRWRRMRFIIAGIVVIVVTTLVFLSKVT